MSWQTLTLTKPGSIAGAAAMADLQALATSVSSVLIHPFQFGVGEGENPQVLSFPNAVSALAIKLAELKPTAVTCVAFTASSLRQLESLLQSAVDSGLLWLITPQQRAELLGSLEKQKWTIKPASETPVIVRKTHTILHIGKIAECYQAQGKKVAKDQGAIAVGDIAAELAGMESKKVEHDGIADAAPDNVDLGSATGYALHLSGGNTENQLRDSGGPGAEKSLTVILCLMGSVADLQIVNEWVGL